MSRLWTSVTLSESERAGFAAAWAAVQSKFVDEPGQAIVDADHLIMQVMRTRAYPVADFEQRAADISVNYPALVSNYRAAREIAVKNEQHQADTDELRQAMIHYRSLFEELLGGEKVVAEGVQAMNEQNSGYHVNAPDIDERTAKDTNVPIASLDPLMDVVAVEPTLVAATAVGDVLVPVPAPAEEQYSTPVGEVDAERATQGDTMSRRLQLPRCNTLPLLTTWLLTWPRWTTRAVQRL